MNCYQSTLKGGGRGKESLREAGQAFY